MSTAPLSQFFEEYAIYHAHPTNKLFHFIGIPMIVVTSIGLLYRVSFVLAAGIAVLVLLFDARLSVRLTIPYAAFMGASFLAAPYLPLSVLWVLFIVGWVLQFVGHFAFEKRSPAFFQNVQQLLVAPLWIIEELKGTPSTPISTPGTSPLGE